MEVLMTKWSELTADEQWALIAQIERENRKDMWSAWDSEVVADCNLCDGVVELV